MAKIFKDKQNTAEKLEKVLKRASNFQGRYPERAAIARKEVEKIQHESDMAHNSTMHYNTFIRASLLALWAAVHEAIHETNTQIEQERITEAELIAKYPDINKDTKTIKQFFDFAPDEMTSWEVYSEHFAAFETAKYKVIDAIRAIEKDRHVQFMACLDQEIVASVPVTKQQHDAYVVLLEQFDYHYDESDDNKVWRRGKDQYKRLKELADKHPHFAKMYEVLVVEHSRPTNRTVSREKWAIMGLDTKA